MGFVDALGIWDRPQNAGFQKRSTFLNSMDGASFNSMDGASLKTDLTAQLIGFWKFENSMDLELEAGRLELGARTGIAMAPVRRTNLR